MSRPAKRSSKGSPKQASDRSPKLDAPKAGTSAGGTASSKESAVVPEIYYHRRPVFLIASWALLLSWVAFLIYVVLT